MVSQLLPLCVGQISYKSNNFQRKKAGEEKSGQCKKQKLHEMLNLHCLQSKTLESRGL